MQRLPASKSLNGRREKEEWGGRMNSGERGDVAKGIRKAQMKGLP